MRLGCRVLDRNFRTQLGELDIVAVTPRALVFCVVKTRIRGGTGGPALPLDAVGRAKRRRIRLMAREWLRRRRGGADRPWRNELRFDAIGVELAADGRLLALEHVENAF